MDKLSGKRIFPKIKKPVVKKLTTGSIGNEFRIKFSASVFSRKNRNEILHGLTGNRNEAVFYIIPRSLQNATSCSLLFT